MSPLGKIEALADYVKANCVDLIYVTLPMAAQPRILQLLNGATLLRRSTSSRTSSCST